MFAGRTCTILWARVVWCAGLTALIVALSTTPGFAQSSGEAAKAGSEKKGGQEKAGEAEDDDKTNKTKEGDDKKDKKKPNEGSSKKDDKEGAIVIPPDLQKQLDELAEIRGRERGEKASKPRSSRRREQQPGREGKPSSRPSGRRSPRGSRADGDRAEMPGNDPMTINIPAVEDTENELPPEEREYEFSLKDATYAQLIEGIARQTGLGVIGKAPKDGKVSFVTTEKLNFDQLMDRVRTLLFKYNLLDPYTIRRQKTHLEVLRVNDALRPMPLDHMFRSVEEFLASGMSDSELALVIYTPMSGSVADLNEIRNFLPDYVRVAPLEGQNRVTIFALVSDIYKYLDLITFFHSDSDDSRPIEKVEVHNILPSAAIAKLEELMDLGSGTRPRGKSTGRKGSRGSVPNPLVVIPKPEITLIPEDAQGVIIVRAMQDKIDEIKRLLPYVDVDTAKGYAPVVIELEHADPDEIIAIVQQILTASEGSPFGVISKSGSRGKKRTSRLPSLAQTAEVTLLPHPAGNAIIVLGEEEQIERVRELVRRFDLEIDVGPLRIALEHAEAGDVVERVKQVLSPGVAGRKGKPAALGFQLVPDSSGKAVWYKGPKKDLDLVRELIAEFDEKSLVGPLQITLEHAEASDLSATIMQVLAAGTGGGKGKGRGKKTAQVGFHLTPDPSGSALWFTGSEKDLATVRDLVATLDVAEEAVSLHVVVLEHRDPSFVADMLRQFDGGAAKPSRRPKGKDRQGRKAMPAAAKFTPDDNGRLLVMCTDQEWERYLPLIEELDATFAEDEAPFVQITLTYIEPAEAIARFTTLLGSDIRAVRYVEAGGNLLVIGATDSQLEDMRTLLTEIDVASELEQRTFEILYADPGEIVTLIETFVGDGGPKKPRGKRPAAKGGRKGKGGAVQMTVSTEAMSIVQLNRQLVVRATGAKMEQIAAIIREFDVPEEDEPLFVRLDIVHIPTSQAIERLEFALPVAGNEGSTITLVPTEGGILLFGATEAQIEDAKAVLAEFDRPSGLLERIFVIRHVDAQELASLLEALVSDRPTGSKPAARPGGKKGRDRQVRTTGGSADSNLQIVQLGDRLVVTATEVKMLRVIELIEEFDVAEETPELRVYEDFPRGADIDAIADTLSTTLDGPSAPGRRPKKGAAKTEGGPRFIPQSAAGKLVVIAKPSQFEKIEELLEVLRVGIEVEQPEIAFIDLEHADAEEVVEKITPLLSIKVQTLIQEGSLTTAPLEGEVVGKSIKDGRGSRRSTAPQRFHLEPDTRNGRIVVAAPPIVIEEATILIKKFDTPDEDAQRVFRTVALHNSGADEMVAAVKEMMDGRAPRRRGPAGPGKGKKAPSPASEEGFVVTTAPGGGAVLLHGTLEDVERATGWIEQLDSEAVAGREIKVYKIVNADIETLVDVIMNVVDTPAQAGKGRRGPRGRRAEPPPEDEFEFQTTLTRVGTEVYIQADLISNTMLVAAGKNKLARIDDLVLQFEETETLADLGGGLDNMPMRIFDLKYAEAFDAAWDLELVLGALWQPANKLPTVEEAPFGNALIVRYPFEDRFAEIEELIAKYVDKRPDPGERITRALAPPKGMSAIEAAQTLMLKHPELNIEVIDVTEDTGDLGVERLKPAGKKKRGNPCVLPTAFQRAVDALTAAAVALDDEKKPEGSSDKDTDEPTPAAEAERESGAGGLDAILSETASRFLDEAEEEDSQPEFEPVKIYFDTKKNALIIEGSEEDIRKIKETLEEVEEEIPEGPPDIRVYRVKYIDVYEAQEILEEMYNTPRRQLAQIQQAQRLAQQRAKQLLQQQQRSQQGGKGKPGEQGKPGTQPGGKGTQPPQVNIPQIPPTTVRVFANPRDRTLILRAETSQYPAILELLAIIDQPRPFESEVRIFHLEKNNATEVEQLLKTFLGIEDSRGRRRSGAGSTGRQQTTTQRGGQPSRLMMQETDTSSGPLGVDPADIKITANADTNTIIAMAPPVALDQIEELINDLESQEIPERITKHYTLEHADVQETADYLNTHFEDGSSTTTPRRRGGRRGGAQQASPRSGPRPLNAPTFIAFTRLSLLTAQATQEQIEKIDELIKVLDVPSETDEWVTVTLAHADAGVVANTLSTMFSGTGAQQQRGRRGGGGRPRAAAGPTFIGAQGEKILFFSAPKNQHEQIHEVIAQIEELSKVSTEVRIIQLEHAEPSTVAEAIESAYGGGRRGGGAPTANFTITPDDPSKRLFVVADDQLFAEIESLAKSLDQKREMPFDFKIYPLQHANARKIHETLNALVRGWVQSSRGGRRGGGMDEAFAVEVDDKANALIVLGSEVVFDFVDKALTTVDIPANAVSPPGFLIVSLKNANAQEVAQNINRLWGQRNLPRGEIPPQVEANRTLNMLIVRGTQEQCDQIKKEFIDPLEEQVPPKLLTETITLVHAQPEAVAESINRVFEDKKRASQALGRGSNVSPLEFTVVVTPDVDTQQLIVQASEANMEFVKARVAELDQPEFGSLTATTMKIYQVKYADPNAVVNIINQWARSRTQGGTRRRQVASRDVVTAVAEHATHSVVVTASVSNHIIIQELIDGLDSEDLATGQRKRQVIPLQHANSDQVANQLTQLARQAPRRRGDRGPGFVSDPTTNSILAYVNDAELEEITGLLETLDVEPGIDTERTMKVYHIKYADPNGIVNTINQTYRGVRGRQVRAVDQVVAVSEWATQSVIVTASAKNHEKIKELIDSIDQEGIGTQEFETVYLQHANADELARQLNDFYGRSRRRTRRGEQPVTIAANPRANAIIVRGKQTDIDEVKELVVAFDVEQDLDQKRTTKPYPLKYADPGSLNGVINYMFRWDRRSAASPSEQVTCAVEWATQSLIVTASAKNHEVIDTLIKQVDVESTFKKQKQLIRLEHANAEDVSRTLGQVLRATQRRTRRGETAVSVSADVGTNSLVVVASDADMEELLPLIESFDLEPPVDKEPVITAYPVRHADVRSLAGAISQAFRPRGGRRPRPEDQVTAVAESGTQTVIVTAVPKNQQKVKAFIDHIDIESDFVPQPHVYHLEHADAEELARSLQQQYRGRRGQQVPQISAVRSSNSLLIRATVRDMEELAELIKPLDVEPDPERDQQIKSFRLSYADPSSVENAINRLFRPSGRSRSPREQVTAVPEWGSKSVIVSASPDNMKRVEALIADLDSEEGGQREVVVLNIEHADPAGVARALNEIYVRSMGRRGGGGEQPVSISEIPGSKAILVKASATDMERIQETVTELDTDVFTAGEAVRVVQLVRSDASEMKTAVEAMLAKPGKGRGRSGDLVGDMRVSLLSQANVLVISGGKDEVDSLEARILAMDAEAGEGTQAQLIRLTHVDPGQILPMLQDMYANPRGGGRRGRGQVQPVITANEALKALIVRASPMDFAEIKATVEQLDVPDAAAGEMIRIVHVPPGHNLEQLAFDLERSINDSAQALAGQGGGGRGRRSSAPSVTIIPDLRSRTLMLAGSVSLFDDVESAIAAMEATGPGGPTTVQVIETTMLNVDDVRRILQQMKGEGSGGSRARRSGSSSSRRGSAGRSPRGRSSGSRSRRR